MLINSDNHSTKLDFSVTCLAIIVYLVKKICYCNIFLYKNYELIVIKRVLSFKKTGPA